MKLIQRLMGAVMLGYLGAMLIGGTYAQGLGIGAVAFCLMGKKRHPQQERVIGKQTYYGEEG